MKRFVKVSLMLASAAVLLSSCNCYKKMAKNADDVNITCTPTVLSLKGNTVSADITVTYPAAYFNKKAVLKVTPVLVFEGGEITGTPKYVQGEKVKDNYTVIAKKQGGSYTQTVTFPYDSRADLCTMELRVEGMRKFTTEVFDTGVALAGHVVMLLVYDWRLALLSLLFTPFSYVCAAWMKKPVQRAGAAYKKAAGALSAATLDRAQNAVTYRIYGCEDARVERYEEALDTYEKTAVKNNVWQSALPPLYLAASEAGVLFILWFGAKNVLGTGWRVWDIAAFTTFLSCFTKLVVKSSKVAKLFNSVQKAEVSWKRIKPLMKSPEQLDALDVPAAEDVTLRNLSFAYGDTPIFSGLSLTAHPGDIIGVTGPVACGKSTFGRVFLCEAPYEGSAQFGKKEFSALTPRQISATVGYLGHDPELSADTVQNNVLCGSKQDAMPYLAAAALKGEVLAMENGLDTVIGSSGTRLSGGQAQRLALARTLAHPRPVLILDDPFSALDRDTEDTVFADLQEYAKDKVVFLISHRLYHFPQMQKIVFMDGGKTTVGTHEELLASAPVYRQLYESQTGGKQHGEQA